MGIYNSWTFNSSILVLYIQKNSRGTGIPLFIFGNNNSDFNRPYIYSWDDISKETDIDVTILFSYRIKIQQIITLEEVVVFPQSAFFRVLAVVGEAGNMQEPLLH